MAVQVKEELTNVLVQLCDEGLAEAGDLSSRLDLRVEVRPSLASSHGQSGQTVLEDLLKAQELDDAQADCGAEPETTLQITASSMHNGRQC